MTPNPARPPCRSPGVPLDPNPVVAGAGPPVPTPQGAPRSPQLLRLVRGSQLPRGGSSGRGESQYTPSTSQYAPSIASTPPSTSQYTFKHNPVLPMLFPVLPLLLPVPPSTSQCPPVAPQSPPQCSQYAPSTSLCFPGRPSISQWSPVPSGTGLRASPSTLPVLHSSFKAIPVLPVFSSLHPSTSSNSSQCSQYPPRTSQYVPVLSNPFMGSFLYLTPPSAPPSIPLRTSQCPQYPSQCLPASP